MGYRNGMNRDQILLVPESVDEYIEANNPGRCIDAYVESLNLAAVGFTQAVPKDTGRPSYTPADLLKLYIYGYLNQIRSSRKLAQETHRNVEVRWWRHKLTPEFKTMADFRQDHGAALRQVCQECTLLCQQLDLCGRELIAIDGSKFQAVNSKDRHFTAPKLQQLLKHIHAKIDMYFNELEQQDGIESSGTTLTADALREKIARLQSRQQHYADLQPPLAASGGAQIS
jgi:transposase